MLTEDQIERLWEYITHDTEENRELRPRACFISFCLRCGVPCADTERYLEWVPKWAKPAHVLCWKDSAGSQWRTFALCEDCHVLLGHPEARIEYYSILLEVWAEAGQEPWELRPSRITRNGYIQRISQIVANGG